MKKKKDTKELTEEEIKNNEVTKKAQKDIFLDYAPYLIIIFFVVVIRLFIATPVMVSGSSMTPTLHNGDYMILYKLTKKMHGIKRFNIVVIETDSGRLIKRVIGLPGDKIKYEITKDEEGNLTSKLMVNGEYVEEDFITEEVKNATCETDWKICYEEVEVPKGEYFVMGDNRINSKDSRMIGTVADEQIIGTTNLVIFPFDRIGTVK